MNYNSLIPITLIAVAALFAPCCSSDEPQSSQAEMSQTASAETIENDILKASVEAYSSFFGVQKDAPSLSDLTSITTPLARSGVADTLFNIVNFPNDGGYVILAAPDSVRNDIVAVVEKGHFNEEDLESESGFALYMEGAKNYLAALSPIKDPEPLRPAPEYYEIRDTTESVIPAKIKNEWLLDGAISQYLRYEIYKSREDYNTDPKPRKIEKFTRDVSVPCMMIMSYFGDPYIFKSESRGISPVLIDLIWDEIRNENILRETLKGWHEQFNEKMNHYSAEGARKITRAVFNKASEEMVFGYSSYNVHTHIPATLREVMVDHNVTDFIDYTANTDVHKVVDGLQSGVVCFHGQKDEEWRIWLCVGYLFRKIHIDYYVREYMQLFGTKYDSEDKYDSYFYFNWCDEGRNNGYYNTSYFPGVLASDVKYFCVTE